MSWVTTDVNTTFEIVTIAGIRWIAIIMSRHLKVAINPNFYVMIRYIMLSTDMYPLIINIRNQKFTAIKF